MDSMGICFLICFRRLPPEGINIFQEKNYVQKPVPEPLSKNLTGAPPPKKGPEVTLGAWFFVVTGMLMLNHTWCAIFWGRRNRLIPKVLESIVKLLAWVEYEIHLRDIFCEMQKYNINITNKNFILGFTLGKEIYSLVYDLFSVFNELEILKSNI